MVSYPECINHSHCFIAPNQITSRREDRIKNLITDFNFFLFKKQSTYLLKVGNFFFEIKLFLN